MFRRRPGGVVAPGSCFECGALSVIAARKRRTLVAEPGAWSQSDSLGAEEFSHVPEGFVELEIFIDAFDSSALGHPVPVRPAARVVALTAADNVFLNRVQGSPKISCSVSKASRIEEHRGADRAFLGSSQR
jgi:hypothetical protein